MTISADLGQNIILMIALTFLFHLLLRYATNLSEGLFVVTGGVVFGLVGLVSMQLPIEVQPGILIDSRVLLTLMAGPFCGGWAALITGSILSVYRYSLGGVGAWAGIGTLVTAAFFGLYLGVKWQGRQQALTVTYLLVVGLLLALMSLAWIFALPDFAQSWQVFSLIALPVLVTTPLAVLLLGLLLRHEMKYLALQSAIQEKELYNRALFEHSPIGLVLSRTNGEVVDVNQAFAQIIGRTVEEAKQLGRWQITPDSYQQDEALHLEKLATTGRHGPYEKELIHLRGHRVPVRLFSTFLVQKNCRYIWSSVEDITETKQAVQALQKSEHRYRSLFLEMITGMALHEVIVDEGGRVVDYRFLEVNPKFEALTGLTAKALIGRTLLEVMPATQRGWIQKYGEVALTGNSIHFEEYDTVLDRYWEVFAYSPQPGQFVSLFLDITERKKNEEALHLIRFSVDNIQDAMYWVRLDGTIANVNQAACQALGYPRERLLSLTVIDLGNAFPNESWQAHWLKVKEEGSYTFEAQHRRQDGEMFPVEVSTNYLDSKGEAFIFYSVRDISERRRVEKERTQLQQQTIHFGQLATVGVLAGGVAHEVNNPNNSIRFNAAMVADVWADAVPFLERSRQEEGDFLLAGIPVAEVLGTMPRLFEGILKSSVRIQGIIQNLKHLSRQDKGVLDQKVDIQEVLSRAIAILQGKINQSCHRFHFEKENKTLQVLGNAQQLEQLFINLILNALQALEDPDRKILIQVVPDPEAKKVCVLVKDEGRGVPGEDLQRLTNPFFSTGSQANGTGLGLSISRSIVENHGGKMSFESRMGEGTTVTIEFSLLTPSQ
ncbi:MAG: PAS domain S-box protein [Magnetococcales bacterium]|nr:PAS domain S-box protein [Magnetococcales bacterium]